jgi:hypothetical protein
MTEEQAWRPYQKPTSRFPERYLDLSVANVHGCLSASTFVDIGGIDRTLQALAVFPNSAPVQIHCMQLLDSILATGHADKVSNAHRFGAQRLDARHN